MSANKIKTLRLQRAWSQEQLAEAAGVSVRTVQRAENGASPGLETLKALASVFETSLDELRGDAEPIPQPTKPEEPPTMNPTTATNTASDASPERDEPKEFYKMATSFVLVLIFLLMINLFTSPGYLWVKWPALGMGLALVSRAISVFGDWGNKRH